MNLHVTPLLRTALLGIPVCLLAGFCVRGPAVSLRQELEARDPYAHLPAGTIDAPQSAYLAAVGGFRGVVADLLWFRSFLAWQEKDAGQQELLMQAACATDPYSHDFWSQSAQVLAYDLPWIIQSQEQARSGSAPAPASVKALRLRYARKAIGQLDRGLKFRPDDARLASQKALILLDVLEDPAAALPVLREAADMPDAPYFIARIHGETLRRLGRNAEAYGYYKDLFRKLPDDEPEACKEVVFGRIRELEDELGIPLPQRFRP